LKTEGIVEPAQWHPLTIYLKSTLPLLILGIRRTPDCGADLATNSSPVAFTMSGIYPTVVVLYQRLVLR